MYLFLALGYVTSITAIAEQLSLVFALYKCLQNRQISQGRAGGRAIVCPTPQDL